jgi:hypothetical protein
VWRAAGQARGGGGHPRGHAGGHARTAGQGAQGCTGACGRASVRACKRAGVHAEAPKEVALVCVPKGGGRRRAMAHFAISASMSYSKPYMRWCCWEGRATGKVQRKTEAAHNEGQERGTAWYKERRAAAGASAGTTDAGPNLNGLAKQAFEVVHVPQVACTAPHHSHAVPACTQRGPTAPPG